MTTESKIVNKEFRKGDVVLNGYAISGVNDLHIIIGSTSRKTGNYSTTRYYESRCLLEGKLQPKSLFSKSENKLTKIGHIGYEAYIIQEMTRLRKTIRIKAGDKR
jgi:hypothetical protein